MVDRLPEDMALVLTQDGPTDDTRLALLRSLPGLPLLAREILDSSASARVQCGLLRALLDPTDDIEEWIRTELSSSAALGLRGDPLPPPPTPEATPEDDTEVWLPPGSPSAEPPPEPGEEPGSLEGLNDRYFVVDECGRHFVATERHDPLRQRTVIVRYTGAEFRTRFANRFIYLPGAERPVNLGKKWLEWPKRRQYLGGIVFDPTGTSRPGVYNLWRGWPVPPAPGDWSLLRDHIFEVLCTGHEDWYRYVFGWLARMVQRPNEPGRVALVFRGIEGAGKSMVGDAIRRLFGQHALAVATPRAVTGQFNAHLRDLVFLLANEAVFAGDRAAFGVLKSILTDETIFLEQKGVDGYEIPNLLHVMMTTNAEWAVPVTLSDRRFAVFDVSPERRGNSSYFASLAKACSDRAVLAALLHDLLTEDLTRYNVDAIPETEARQEQALRSLDGPTAWLVHVLTIGSLGLTRDPVWEPAVTTAELQSSIELWARNGRHRQEVSPVVLGKFLTRFFPPTRFYSRGVQCRGWRVGDLHEAQKKVAEVLHMPRLFGDIDCGCEPSVLSVLPSVRV